jgi:hypothetical protein
MLGHDNIAEDDELKTAAYLFHDREKKVSAVCGTQERETVVAATGDEVEVTAAVVSFEAPGHEGRVSTYRVATV